MKLKKQLKEQKVGVIFRENGQSRIYGVTFIDYQNRTVMNGSRLGKEFSANVFNDLFNNPVRQADESKHNIITNIFKQTEHIYQTANSDSSLGSAFGLLDMSASGNDYEEENFVHEYERRKKKAKKQGRRL
jgi:UDP-N-acetylglucosamine pyrophosphorylase